ncbi:3-dehydroquinate synthase [Deltaproteobacteria bacterium]|nr:3-dehydroquinate synthase [Deltaproteobacteria bacterium]
MESIVIHGRSKDSKIMIGESIENVAKYLPPEETVIITDRNVYRYYHQVMPTNKIIQIGTGEKIKNLDTVEFILKELMEMKAGRNMFLLGIGGGIVCDIAGFTASIYLRGVGLGFVSTTLLSQVDASVGGKNGVNFEGYKNMVGVFNQPDFVICDPVLLKTLPEKERLNGCAEIVKHAAIADRDLFTYLEENYKEILDMREEVIEKLVHDSVIIKSEVVNRDEEEKGERRKLNFGHTLAHAIEKVTGASHGEAVSAGMVAAARLSKKRGILPDEDRARIEKLIDNLRLPTEIPADREKLLEAITRDKKREGDCIHFILLKGIGKAVSVEISIRELEDTLI